MGEARDGSAAATTSVAGENTPVTGVATPGSGVAGVTGAGPDPLIGRLINDRYHILSLLARGGMGRVYAGEQAPLGRPVALKVLHPNYKGEHDPDFHRRFFLEAATCAKLTHPNTVTIFDYGRTDDDVYYIAMELLEGRTLHRALRDDGPLSPARALHIARQVCRSLREAHSIHVVHRDLKPANVFLCRRDDDDDFVKVLDFGLVKNTEDTAEDLTQTGLFMGSPKYMAPEQIQGERADGRVDIYALGVMLYEMLTGKVPFDRPNSVNILMAHVHDAPPPFETANPAVHIAPALEAVVLRCLAKRPADRYATMDQVLAALKELGEGVGSSSVKSLSDSDVIGPSLLLSSDSGSLPAASGEHGLAPSFTPSGVVVVQPVSSLAPDAAGRVSSATELPRGAATPPASRQGIGLLALVLCASALGAGLLWWQSGSAPSHTTTPMTHDTTGAHSTGASSAGASSTTDPTSTTPSPDPVVQEPTVPRLHVTVGSSPPGASVQLGTRALGTTPLDMELVGEEARTGAELTFVLSLPGFQTTTLRRIVDGATLHIDARLPRRSTGGMTSGSPSHVQGYRDDPYADP